MAQRWRVQATWTVEGARRSYAPQFARTEIGAKRLKRKLEKTLAYFPTLEVRVGVVDAEDARAEEQALAGSVGLPAAVHLIAEPLAENTACGLPTAEVKAVAVAELFELSGNQCAECVQAQPAAARA